MNTKISEYKKPKALVNIATLLVLLLTSETHAIAMKADFNGDGFEDLVVAVPSEDLGGKMNAGAVKIVYGRANGTMPSTAKVDYLHQAKSGVSGIHLKGVVEAYDHFGSAVAVGDFNHDNYDDLAIGTATEDVGSTTDAGLVNIVYGSANGLVARNNHMLNFQKFENGIHMRKGSQFGTALAVGDYNGDNIEDLAVSYLPTSTEYGSGNINRGGGVIVFFGNTSMGLINGEVALTTTRIRGAFNVTKDAFGKTLASGDLNDDGYDELIVGNPYYIGGGVSSGSINIAWGAADWRNNLPELIQVLPDTNDQHGRFGAALAVGNFDHDSHAELAVGMPDSGLGGKSMSGAVIVLDLLNNGQFTQESFYQSKSFIPGSSEKGERFGGSLTTADFNGDGYDELAIGIPLESKERWYWSDIKSHGAVAVLYGAQRGLYRSEIWHQGTYKVDGGVENFDSFGRTLSTGDFNNDGKADLLVGVPGESVGSTQGAGVVQFIWGGSTGLTATIPGKQLFHQGSFQGQGFGTSESEYRDNFGGTLLH